MIQIQQTESSNQSTIKNCINHNLDKKNCVSQSKLSSYNELTSANYLIIYRKHPIWNQAANNFEEERNRISIKNEASSIHTYRQAEW